MVIRSVGQRPGTAGRRWSEAGHVVSGPLSQVQTKGTGVAFRPGLISESPRRLHMRCEKTTALHADEAGLVLSRCGWVRRVTTVRLSGRNDSAFLDGPSSEVLGCFKQASVPRGYMKRLLKL